MQIRYIQHDIQSSCFSVHKMALVSGPRQCGKTTLARMFLAQRIAGEYFNWDDIEFRRTWAQSPKSLVPQSSEVPLLIFDEIHKARLWKRTLKGLYDTLRSPVDILITGSARLNVLRRSGESMTGRYFHFRLHPFSLAEIIGYSQPPGPDQAMEHFRKPEGLPQISHKDAMENLMHFGAFPEPFLSRSDKAARMWRSARIEEVIRIDLRDLSGIRDLSRIEMLAALLPHRIGSPLSINSLREDLEVNHQTCSFWLEQLKQLYYLFGVKPWHKSVARSLKKEEKVYLWDFGEVSDEGPRFENCIAVHLLKACDYWSDTGQGSFELCYVRNKEKQEIDFVIIRDAKPWLPIEVKLSDASLSPAWHKLLPQLGCSLGIQVVRTGGIRKTYAVGNADVIVISAEDFLRRLV